MATQTAQPSLETKVRLYHDARGNRELLGFAELIIDKAFVIKDISIIRSKAGGNGSQEPFISFPSKKGSGSGEGKYFDIAHPITAEAHQMASAIILRAYHEAQDLAR